MDQHGRSLQFISKSELKQMRKDGKSLELLHTHNPEPAEPKLTLWERLRDNKTGKEIDLRERQRVNHKMDDEDILFLLHQEEQAKSLSETWKQEEEAFQKAVEEYVHTSTTEVKPSVVLLPTKSSPEEKKKNKKKPMINIQIVPKTKQNQSLQTKESSMKNNQHQDSKLLQTFTSAEERKRTRDSEFHSSVIEGPSIKRMKSSTHDNESSNNHKSVSADIPSSTSNPSQTQSSTSDFSKEIPENDNTTALVNYTLDDTD